MTSSNYHKPEAIDDLALGFQGRHSATTVSLATLVQLTTSCFFHVTKQQGHDLDPLLDLLRKCVDQYAAAQGVTAFALDRAIGDLQRGQKAAEALWIQENEAEAAEEAGRALARAMAT